MPAQNPQSPPMSELPPSDVPRILAFSDTFGSDAGNGVARFLHDLHDWSQRASLPLEFVIPSRGPSAAGLMQIRAPSFVVPGYGKLFLATPLRHHRKIIERHIKHHRPDCIHVSTPGPFGCFGLSLAQRYRIPLVGIYHTEFPSYFRDILLAQWKLRKSSPQHVFSPLISKAMPLLTKQLEVLETANPQLVQDLETMLEIVGRNYRLLDERYSLESTVADAAKAITESILRKFYAPFDLVLARSTTQQAVLAETLQRIPERVGCLQPGTDIERFHPRFRDRSVWDRFGIPGDDGICLYVGRLTAEKNFGFLLETWKRVRAEKNLPLRLVIVGHGEPEQIQAAQSVPDVCVIGSQQGELLSTIYASSDLLLFPSVTETLGQVGLEAGASGLPVIVSDQGGPQMYVLHEQTGHILPTHDPQAWAQCILSLFADVPLMKRMGEQARQRVAGSFSFQDTIDSYWNLHREAMQRRTKKKRKSKRPLVPVIARNLESHVPQQGVMILSDFHAGKRCASETQRKQKQAAVREFLQFAQRDQLDLILAGDFGDHGSRVPRLEADFEGFRKTRQDLGIDGEPVFLRGNHDYGYTDEQIYEYVGGCQVQSSLVYKHAGSGVTVTHGHILGIAKTLQIIQAARSPDELIEQLREDLLDEDLKPSVIAYDFANLVESTLAEKGLNGVSTLWEGMFQTRAVLAEQLLHYSRSSNDADEATWKMIAGLVGTHDNVKVAGMLGIGCGGWASIFGHTHEPLARRTRIRVSDKLAKQVQLVANAGHINRKRPTCVVARFPEVTVYQYDAAWRRIRPLYRTWLTGADIEAYVESHPSQRECA